MARRLPDDLSPRPLTPREREILVLLATGASNPAIAQQLGISRYTVEGHVKHLREKLGATNRQHAVMLALEAGIIRPDELA
jgi:two-component system, NarL family, response regulator